MVIESQYILALYNQRGPQGVLCLHPSCCTWQRQRRQGHLALRQRSALNPDVLGQPSLWSIVSPITALDTFVLPTSSLPRLCIWDTIFFFLCSLPVSDHSLAAVPLSLLAPWCWGVPEHLLSHGVPCLCRAPSSLSTVSSPGRSHSSLAALCSCWAAVRKGSFSPPPLGGCACRKYGPFIVLEDTITVIGLLSLKLLKRE